MLDLLLRLRLLALLPWVVLSACGLLLFDHHRAEAEEVLASWYGPGYYGEPTASGEPYSPNGFTAAHKTLPLGTRLTVSYGGRSVQVTVNDREPSAGDRSLDLSQGAAQALGLVRAGTDYVEISYPNGSSGSSAGYPAYPESYAGTGTHTGPVVGGNAPSAALGGSAHSSFVNNSSVVSKPEDGAAVQPIKPPGNNLQGVVGNGLAAYDQAGVTGDADYTPPTEGSADISFIAHQEGFRLDGYVPDPQFSRSGVTIGTGVDLGQRSVAEIEALNIPQELKWKLEPYAGLKRQDAVYFLSSHPLHITEDEANALDQAVSQRIIGTVANRYDAAAPGRSFAELPLGAQTAIEDVAYQYGPNLAQRAPTFWGDATQGRWKSAARDLNNFGDRYSTRRDAEASLLEQAINNGGFGAYYVVQPGDTLSGIAARLGTSTEYLRAHNGIVEPDVIRDGQTLFY